MADNAETTNETLTPEIASGENVNFTDQLGPSTTEAQVETAKAQQFTQEVEKAGKMQTLFTGKQASATDAKLRALKERKIKGQKLQAEETKKSSEALETKKTRLQTIQSKVTELQEGINTASEQGVEASDLEDRLSNLLKEENIIKQEILPTEEPQAIEVVQPEESPIAIATAADQQEAEAVAGETTKQDLEDEANVIKQENLKIQAQQLDAQNKIAEQRDLLGFCSFNLSFCS